MARDQSFELRLADAQQFAVAQGDEFGRMRVARDHRHFADRFAGRNVGDEVVVAVLVVREHAERARDDDEHGLIVVAFAREHGAARQREPLRMREKRVQARDRRFRA